jgi:DNA-binding NtrC family response regulator
VNTRFDGKLIMIVDDELGAVFSRMIRLRGGEAVYTDNAISALTWLEECERLPDAMLVDVVLIGPIDGVGLVRMVSQRYPQIGLVCISGYGQPPDLTECAFVAKPPQPEMLFDALAEAADAGENGDNGDAPDSQAG